MTARFLIFSTILRPYVRGFGRQAGRRAASNVGEKKCVTSIRLHREDTAGAANVVALLTILTAADAASPDDDPF